MKKLIIISVILFYGLCAGAKGFTDRNIIKSRYSFEQVKESLVMNQKWVPYPAYSDREGWEKLMGSHRESYIRKGENYLDYQWKVVHATAYLAFEKDGNRMVMENPYHANNDAIAKLFAAELAEGKGRFIPQLIDGMFHTCEMTSWALSAHLHSITKNHESVPEKGDNTLELTQGDVSHMFSWIYYFLHDEFDKINPVFSRRFRDEIRSRELEPYLQREDIFWMGLGEFYNRRSLNNWNPWCNFNALMSFMLLEDDKDVLAQAVWKSIISVDQYLNNVSSDGGIDEGPTYWNHSAGRIYDYFNALRMITGGKVNLFDEKLVRDMGEFIVRSYVGDCWVVNFADASARGGNGMNLIYRYGKAVGSELMMGYAAYRRDESGEDIPSAYIYFSRFLDDVLYLDELNRCNCEYKPSAYTWYPETQFHFNTNPSGAFLAVHGGDNGESHNHNDVGSFNLYYDCLPFIIDVGVGTYTKQTFNSERYKIWTMQSSYHNVPEINAVAQKAGGAYRSTDVVSTPTTFSADISKAYPEEAKVNKWVRSYGMKGDKLTVTDKFSLSEAIAPNVLHFMTWGDVDTSKEGSVFVTVKGKTVEMQYDKSVFTASSEAVEFSDPRLTGVWGNRVYRINLTAKSLSRSGRYSVVFTRK